MSATAGVAYEEKWDRCRKLDCGSQPYWFSFAIASSPCAVRVDADSKPFALREAQRAAAALASKIGPKPGAACPE